MTPSAPIYIGIDIGTSGVRACAINHAEECLHICKSPLSLPIKAQQSIIQDANLWWAAIQKALKQLFGLITPSEVEGISVNGTSGTVLVCDAHGEPLAPARMYNDTHCGPQAELIRRYAPNNTAAHGASSGLSKLLYLQQNYPHATYYLHQTDWIIGKLCGRFNITDENNALKTGYNPLYSHWPEWLSKLNLHINKLPDVVPPGTSVGWLKTGLFNQYQINPHCQIISGTTDSIAAVIATGANKPGDAVTALGSTLVLKILSEKPIFAPEFGIYSHRLGESWLAGGASNSGGNVLRHYFNSNKIKELTELLNLNYDKNASQHLHYYPLTQAGERFPTNDPNLQPHLLPKAKNDLIFFQAMLEGISEIERNGYLKLQQLGVPYPNNVETTGGGSCNSTWQQIRQHCLNVKVEQAKQGEACYGSALLAKQGVCRHPS